ncbi:MAG TPA: hypothetical protein VGA33_01960 [Thermoanaerobaculia bacterium]
MLVSDLIEIPHAALADWVALIGSAIVYLMWATIVFFGSRVFVKRTGMRALSNLLAALLLVAGLVGYYEVFVMLDRATFAQAVRAALPGVRRGDTELTRLSNNRARTILAEEGPIVPRRIAFFLLPVAAAAIAVAIAPPAPRG